MLALVVASFLIRGVVVDGSGLPIAGARVAVEGSSTFVVTNVDGRFVLNEQPPAVLLVDGVRHVVTDAAEVRLVSGRTVFSDEVVVTAARTAQRLSETPASVVVLSAAELRSSAAPALDDALRQVPGFTLFRRSGSRTANPTTHGATLRGVGASGASRAIVLEDGIPLNDPFGGWVNWGRVPRLALERVEVLRGGASELYGSGALTGVIQLIRRDSDQSWAIDASYGSESTAEGSVRVATRHDPWSFALSAEAFRSDGYIQVPADLRGPVDGPVNSSRGVIDLTVNRTLKAGGLFARASIFDEERANGTPLQVNDSATRQLAVGLNALLGDFAVAGRAYGIDQLYHQTFSAIAADRRSERLTRTQEVPVDAYGVGGQISTVRGAHTLIGGLESREVDGSSNEEIIGATVTRSDSGGTQRMNSAFLEDLIVLSPRVILTVAARLDSWRNFEAFRTTETVSSPLPARSDSAFSPRIAGMLRVNDHLSLAASAYRSFRAPTLNELYRTFRVGNVVTLANEELRAERLQGIEGSAIFSAWHVDGRATVYEMTVEENVANVTLSSTPELITRQRQNLGQTRARGFELDAQARPGSRFNASFGYLYVNSTVRSFAANPELVGRHVPQVPKHQASVQISSTGRTSIGIQTRWVDSQFEDDLNQLALNSYVAADILISRSLHRGGTLFIAAENLFDEQYEIGRTPVPTIGPPRSLRAGIRFHKQK